MREMKKIMRKFLILVVALFMVLSSAGNSWAQSDSAGWAKTGGIIGVGTTGMTLIFGSVAASRAAAGKDGTAVGAVATVFLGAGVPVAASAAASARRHTGVRGIGTGPRIAGWIGYGVSMLQAVTMVGIGVADGTVPSGLILGTTLTGTATGALFTADAFISHKQAREVALNDPSKRQMIAKRKPLHPVAGFRMLEGGGMLQVAMRF
jgi:hypothetical protein